MSISPTEKETETQTTDPVERFRTWKKGRNGQRSLVALTAYDYPTARMLEEEGVDVVLVGDSLGMVVLGFEDTTQVTMEHMMHHTAAVARGAKDSFIVADLPYQSYETSLQALENAVALKQAGADAVKLEGGVDKARIMQALTREGIAVMGHIGMQPQSVRAEGGYKMKGKTPEDAERLGDEARALEEAGAFAMVLELVRPEVAAQITREVSVPTIGIGSGNETDGQILVTSDLVGAFPWFRPRFAPLMGDVAGEFRKGVRAFRENQPE
jgi:3-methyl-2-oxobutanoate hydroxymethyltransferase